jgi:hypothetical protein
MIEQPEPSMAALLDFLSEDTPGRDPRIGTAGYESLVAVAGCDESVQ